MKKLVLTLAAVALGFTMSAQSMEYQGDTLVLQIPVGNQFEVKYMKNGEVLKCDTLPQRAIAYQKFTPRNSSVNRNIINSLLNKGWEESQRTVLGNQLIVILRSPSGRTYRHFHFIGNILHSQSTSTF